MKLKINLSKFNGIGLHTLAIGSYFILLPLDCINIGSLGSVLKLLAIIPLGILIFKQPIQDIKVHLNKLSISIAIIILSMIVCNSFSVIFERSTFELISFLSNVLFIFILGATIKYTEKEQDFLYIAYVFGGLVLLIMYCLYGNFEFEGRLSIFVDASADRASQDQNYVNGYMLPFYCFCLNDFLRRKTKLPLFSSLSLFAVMLLTGSRGSLIAYLSVSIYLICCNAKNILKLLASMIILSITLFSAYLIYDQFANSSKFVVFDRFTYQFISGHGTTGRFDLWNDSLLFMSESSLFRLLVGYGLRASTVITHAHNVAHNLFIEFFVSAGIIGLLSIINIFYQCYKKINYIENNTIMAAFLGFLVMSMSLSIVNYKPLWSLILIVMILQKRNIKQKINIERRNSI